MATAPQFVVDVFLQTAMNSIASYRSEMIEQIGRVHPLHLDLESVRIVKVVGRVVYSTQRTPCVKGLL